MNDTRVTRVEILSVSVPEWLEESLAAEAMAERQRRAKLVAVETEFQAAARLGEPPPC